MSEGTFPDYGRWKLVGARLDHWDHFEGTTMMLHGKQGNGCRDESCLPGGGRLGSQTVCLGVSEGWPAEGKGGLFHVASDQLRSEGGVQAAGFKGCLKGELSKDDSWPAMDEFLSNPEGCRGVSFVERGGPGDSSGSWWEAGHHVLLFRKKTLQHFFLYLFFLNIFIGV